MEDKEIRGGNRGGRALFSWDKVKSDKDKPYYLGNSVFANTGRWQNNQDLYWYRRTGGSQSSSSNNKKSKEEERIRELKELKEREKQLLNIALGYSPDDIQSISQSSQSSKQVDINTDTITTTNNNNTNNNNKKKKRVDRSRSKSIDRTRSRRKRFE